MISRRTCKPQYEISESIILINSLNVLELIEIKFRRNLEKNLKSTTCIALASLPPRWRRQIDDWEKSSQPEESVKKKDKILSANIENQSKWNSMRKREKMKNFRKNSIFVFLVSLYVSTPLVWKALNMKKDFVLKWDEQIRVCLCFSDTKEEVCSTWKYEFWFFRNGKICSHFELCSADCTRQILLYFHIAQDACEQETMTRYGSCSLQILFFNYLFTCQWLLFRRNHKFSHAGFVWPRCQSVLDRKSIVKINIF